MEDISSRCRIVIREFPGRGRGLVAAEAIPRGRLIERSPVLVIPEGERQAIDRGLLFTYVFIWEKGWQEQDLYHHRGRAGLALGYTTLLNHSYHPNVDYVHHVDEAFLDIVAIRDIRPGEELTIDYEMDLWFDPGEPEPADLAARRAERARCRAAARDGLAHETVHDLAIPGHSAGSA